MASLADVSFASEIPGTQAVNVQFRIRILFSIKRFDGREQSVITGGRKPNLVSLGLIPERQQYTDLFCYLRPEMKDLFRSSRLPDVFPNPAIADRMKEGKNA